MKRLMWKGRGAIANSMIALALTAGSLTAGLLGGCTVAETSPVTTGDAPSADISVPHLRLPTIRLSNRSVVPIESLMADSADESVTIQGTVAQRVALLDGWLYQLRDETGSLWIVADGSEPDVGQQVTVEGTVRYEAITVEDIDAGEVYLEEQAYRREAD